MKIIKIVDERNWGMVPYQALNNAIDLKKKGVSVSVVCPKGTRLLAECVKSGIKVEELGFSGRFGLADSEECDIVHFYNTRDFPNLAYSFYSKKRRLVFSHYDLEEKEKIKKIEKHIGRFVVPSSAYRENLASAGVNEKKISVVYPAVNLTRWESAMRIKPLMFEKLPYQIVSISFDKTGKEQELFLKVCKMLDDKSGKPMSFAILGEKSEKLRKIARKIGISHKVDFLGYREDLPEIMALAHVFVKTTIRPSLSLSLIEAQASGIPVVIPRLPGLSDFTFNNKNGILVEPGKAENYFKAVTRILSEPELMMKLSRFAFNYVEKNMTLDVSANMLAIIYGEILL